MDIELDRHATEEVACFLEARLDEHNLESSGTSGGESLHIAARAGNGEIVAGLSGRFGWDWLHVHVVWVRKDLRGLGLGRRLLAAAEEEARARELVGVGLTSFDFQAPAFYRSLGYEEVGCIPDYPRGGSLHFLAKRL